jgi:hypothetical protein
VSEGEELRLGQRVGAIRFGSQVDLLLPLEKDIRLAVEVGDRLVAGRTIVAVVANKCSLLINVLGAQELIMSCLGNPQFDEVGYVRKGRRRSLRAGRILLCLGEYP